jgi:hypothetical protein
MYNRLNILASYAFLQREEFFQNLLEAISPYVNVLIDSGAHSNHMMRIKKAAGKRVSGKEVTLGGYMDYIQRKAHGKVWQYITLDVIRNRTETDRNLQTMLDAGLTPMPVYIEGYDENDLPRLLAITPRLCVAGGVGSSDTYIRRRYKTIHQLSKGVAKIHGLGYGRWPGTFHADIASCDSSSFNYGSRYGVLTAYNRDKGFDNFQWKMLDQSKDYKPGKRSEFIAYMGYTFGLTVTDLNNKDTFKGVNSYMNMPTLTGCTAYLNFMKHVQEYGKDYFIAAPSYGFVFALVAVAAAEGAGAFDWKTISDFYAQIEKARKDNPDKCLELIQTLLEKYTKWQMLPHSL